MSECVRPYVRAGVLAAAHNKGGGVIFHSTSTETINAQQRSITDPKKWNATRLWLKWASVSAEKGKQKGHIDRLSRLAHIY